MLVAGSFVALVLGFYFLGKLGETYFGIGSARKPDDPRFQEIAVQMVPVMDAIELYRKQNGKYPEREQDIRGLLPAGFQVRARMGFFVRDLPWMAHSLPDQGAPGYRLIVVLGKESSMYFDSRSQSWTFTSGMGDPDTPLPLKFR